jgi:hypothetical protein
MTKRRSPGLTIDRDFARALDPILLARDCGIEPDDVQAKLLTSTSPRILLCCTRQWGKSTICALMALHYGLYKAPATIVLISPSQNQSLELFKKVHDFWSKIPGAPHANQESLSRMTLSNGSRFLALPGSEKTSRGFTADMVIVDESARVPDDIYSAVRPMLATKPDGRFICLSTPSGRRGFFFEAWNSEGWEKIQVKAEDCVRISKEFLIAERVALGELMFQQEYCCSFHSESGASVFDLNFIQGIFSNANFKPFFADS